MKNQKANEDFALRISTINGTGADNIMDFLDTTLSHVVCAQETTAMDDKAGQSAGRRRIHCG